MEFIIKKFDIVTSTNDLAKEEANKGANEGTVIIADRQSAGRGRLGRSFLSPEGGLYMSIILRPQNSADALSVTTRAAVSVALAIEKHISETAQIKWVNDIYQKGKKVCGILAEAVMEGSEIAYIILGIGVNLKETPSELMHIAGGIGDVSRNALMQDILDEYFGGTWNCFEEYSKRDMLKGKTVTVFRGDTALYTAAAEGISPDFGLKLRLNDGSETVLYSGEVSVREGENKWQN